MRLTKSIFLPHPIFCARVSGFTGMEFFRDVDEHLDVGAFANFRDDPEGVGEFFHVGQPETGTEAEAPDKIGGG